MLELILILALSFPVWSTVTSTILIGNDAFTPWIAFPWFWFPLFWFTLLNIAFPKLLLFPPPKEAKILSVLISPTSIGIEVDCRPISWQTIPIYPVFGAVLKLEDLITLLKSFEALLTWAKALYAWPNNLFPVILVSALVINCSLSIKSAKRIKWLNIFWFTITYFLKLLLIAVKTFCVVFNKGKGILGSTFLDINSSAEFNSFSIFFKWASYFLSVLDGVIGNWAE